MRRKSEERMNRTIAKARGNRRKLALTLVLVFMAGWLSYAYYLYSNQIMIIPVTGEIVSFQPTALQLYQAKLDRNVKAVILDLNTPGGYADSAMEIASYVEDLSRVKPVIAVMEDMCASGGYYIASFADYIFTHSNTVTGSIGVIAMWVDMSKYNEKQGINITVWKTGTEKDLGADYRPPTPKEYNDINATVHSIFKTLLTDIQRNRNLSEDALKTVKTGAAFSGSYAVQLGLADKIGNIVDAVEEAVQRAKTLKFILVTPDMDTRQRFLRALL